MTLDTDAGRPGFLEPKGYYQTHGERDAYNGASWSEDRTPKSFINPTACLVPTPSRLRGGRNPFYPALLNRPTSCFAFEPDANSKLKMATDKIVEGARQGLTRLGHYPPDGDLGLLLMGELLRLGSSSG